MGLSVRGLRKYRADEFSFKSRLKQGLTKSTPLVSIRNRTRCLHLVRNITPSTVLSVEGIKRNKEHAIMACSLFVLKFIKSNH